MDPKRLQHLVDELDSIGSEPSALEIVHRRFAIVDVRARKRGATWALGELT